MQVNSTNAKKHEDSPEVSVIIPAYQVTEYIAETLRSVVEQTYTNYEVIVVNDGCPDSVALEKAIEPFREKIKYLVQSNQGASVARNTGVENSTGEIVAFLDGDDLWLPNYLESQITELENRGLDMVYSDAFLFGNRAVDGRLYSENAPSEGEVTFDSLLAYRCCPILSGSVVRREALLGVDGFAAELRRAMDYDLWLRLAYNRARIGYQLKPLLKYRVRTDGISGTNIKRVCREIELFERFKRIFHLTPRQRSEIEFRLRKLDSDLDLEIGRSFFVSGDFELAAGYLSRSNQFRNSARLSLIVMFVRFLPKPFRLIYLLLRKSETALASPAEVEGMLAKIGRSHRVLPEHPIHT